MKIIIKENGSPYFDSELLEIQNLRKINDNMSVLYLGSEKYKYLSWSKFSYITKGCILSGISFDNGKDGEDFSFMEVCFEGGDLDFYVVPLKWQYAVFILKDIWSLGEDVDFEIEKW